jgi:predicted 3-demethylubiquinone-9 3-methyltransferase (glyoxalase superfamily)
LVSITPFLWFDNELEAALKLYSREFPDVVVHEVQRGGLKDRFGLS